MRQVLWVSLGLVALMGILSIRTTVDPTRPQVYEMSAIRNLHRINLAQIDYRSKYGRCARSLSELGPPADGQDVSASAANLIEGGLAEGSKSGYRYTRSVTPAGYVVNADR